MQRDDVVAAVFENHEQADAAVKKLAAAGFAMKHLSLVGKGYHTEETVTGFYNFGDRVTFWGSRGAFWGGMWGLFVGGLFLSIPILGHVVVLGYLAATAISAVEGAAVFGGLGVIGGAIASIGVPEDSVLKYETAIKADDFLVMAHGDLAEVERARGILAATHPKEIKMHLLAAASQMATA